MSSSVAPAMETGWELSPMLWIRCGVAILEEAVMTTLPDELRDRFNFATPNATDEEMDLMPWAVD